jgi:hypothetical protein
MDSAGGNSLCHPFEFWQPGNDVGVSGWKNVISFNRDTFDPYSGAPSGEQLLTSKDLRNGPNSCPQGWPNCGLNDYKSSNLQQTLQPCFSAPCADLRGSLDTSGDPSHQDFENWIFWQWRGRISLTSTWPVETNTRYPSTTGNEGGQTGALSVRPGDWAEMGYTGNLGQNIQEPLHDVADQFGVMTTVGLPVAQGGLNWGKVITRTVYLWGEPQVELPSSKSSQTFGIYTTPCSPTPCQPIEHKAWLDVSVGGTYGSYSVSGGSLDRVRFTKAYVFLFYANLQGNYGATTAPGCAAGLPNSGSSAWGIFPDIVVPIPGPGSTCSTNWDPGGGVYIQPIDPGGP